MISNFIWNVNRDTDCDEIIGKVSKISVQKHKEICWTHFKWIITVNDLENFQTFQVSDRKLNEKVICITFFFEALRIASVLITQNKNGFSNGFLMFFQTK